MLIILTDSWRVTTELRDTKEDLKYQTSLVQSSFKENKSIYTQHRDQRTTVQELRLALKEAQNKKGSTATTSTSCQTTMDLESLMESVRLNPTDPKEPLSCSPKKLNSRALKDTPPQQPARAAQPIKPNQPHDHQSTATSLLPLASSVLRSPTTSETLNTSPSLAPQIPPTRKVMDKPSQTTKATTHDHKADPPKLEQASSTSSSVNRSHLPSQLDYVWHAPTEVYELKKQAPRDPLGIFHRGLDVQIHQSSQHSVRRCHQ